MAKLTGELDAARAQMEQHDRQRDAAKAQIAAVDAEAVIVEELAALRRTVTGEIRGGRESGLDELRAVLRRLFVGFELASPTVRFGLAGFVGECIGVQSDQVVYYLIPYLRPQAVDLEHYDGLGLPSVQRVPLRDNLCTTFLAV